METKNIINGLQNKHPFKHYVVLIQSYIKGTGIYNMDPFNIQTEVLT